MNAIGDTHTLPSSTRPIDPLMAEGLPRGGAFGIWESVPGRGHGLVEAVLDLAAAKGLRTVLVSVPNEARLSERRLEWDPARGIYRSQAGDLTLWDPTARAGGGAWVDLGELQAEADLLIIDEPMWLCLPGDSRPLQRLARSARAGSKALVVLASSSFIAPDHAGWLSNPSDAVERLQRLRLSMDVVFETTPDPRPGLRILHRRWTSTP